MSEIIRVGLADDQPLVRAGFGMLVGSQDDMEVVWEVSDGDEVAAAAAARPADVVLMDVQMPRMDGIAAARALLVSDESVRIIMLTTFDDAEFVRGAIEAGASGFLLKDATPDELLHAVRTVYEGDAVLAPKVTAQVMKMWRPKASESESVDVGLTPRESEILKHIARGLTNEEIAAAEFVSMATVKTHVRHILMKTGSRDRVQAVLFAFRTGLVTVGELLRHPQG
ncbi:response regulator [Corynebacterium vitaeruminis]|uniref:Two-component system response regulator TcsR7 n=1 Tax=Corynebacterium vitaeruminis DSM 20294 TaxID=1224164 RepID=W5Y4K9_9CORY|nr:response regulator transcription factor [Corynebacterium vitaeruminis]AHI23849.1 two-component system response regulator TcsR7 [Corynebacterium vitaeruminis DSM 20294]